MMYTLPMQQTCANPWCKQQFEITDDDLAFYKKVSPVFNGKKELIPPPTRCPECRQQRRLAWRNERNLFNRKCDLTGESIVSMYPIEVDFPVYETSAWWGDDLNTEKHEMSVKLNMDFIVQFNTLLSSVPHMSLLIKQCENCSYNNDLLQGKNCYLCFAAGGTENVCYSNWIGFSRDSMDCSYCTEIELCYQCLNTHKSNHGFFLEQCSNVHDSFFLFDCIDCNDCFCCAGIRNKRFCLENKQLSKSEYQEAIKHFSQLTSKNIFEWKARMEKLKNKLPRKESIILQSEHCSGNSIRFSKNCKNCFDIINTQDLNYCYDSGYDVTDCMDVVVVAPDSTLSYEIQSGVTQRHVLFSNFTWEAHEMFYCSYCFSCHDCFGCIGLRHKQYCILNKQYTKKEYERLVPKIIEKMRVDGEWGEFFPVEISPFAYNETVAQEYFPLTKKEVEARGWKWREKKDEIPQVEKIIPAEKLPNSITDIPDDVSN